LESTQQEHWIIKLIFLLNFRIEITTIEKCPKVVAEILQLGKMCKIEPKLERFKNWKNEAQTPSPGKSPNKICNVETRTQGFLPRKNTIVVST
jgi:hypothetical protein